MEFVTFTIIIDDIVHPDGRTLMESLGGGGPQTAFGARLWLSESDTRIGLAASVGPDFPNSCLKWVKDMQIDCEGLLPSNFPTMRAWQILESDGRRTQVWRVAVGDEVWDMLRPPIETLPSGYKRAKVYHVGVHPSARDVPFILSLRATGAEVVSIETYTHSEIILTLSELRALITSAHIFSPNDKEAMSLVGPGTPMEVIKRLVELGAMVVSLRRGSLGCIVHRADTGETWDIPAFHTIMTAKTLNEKSGEGGVTHKKSFDCRVVDPTGCGNTFCGGFAAGWWKTRDLLTSGLWGSVSASFMIEHEGVPPPPIQKWRSEVQMRLQMLKPFARQLRLDE
ncbi:hypothetical protein GOP47_0001967 [Adiantum capillus-veneris]|uniref:Carbohydrate kinase PfkB domain-containing protein n=1 Tax=Adiantum capillus-veneris TaxID=13818 RepID=A0A9D4ZNR9_ADICA|nr:hypothetical protein GOP47_0001967 [Adiantum capillus-veneris]